MQEAITSLDKAAEKAEAIFRLNDWTWRDDPKPPTRLEIAAVFSSLAWSLRDASGMTGDGRIHLAAGGRLLVTMDSNGTLRYNVQLAFDH